MSPAAQHPWLGRPAPGIADRRAAPDIRSRELYFHSLAAFRNNLLDAADLAGGGIRGELLGFLRVLDAAAPTSEHLDAAAAGRLTKSDELQIVGSGRGLL